MSAQQLLNPFVGLRPFESSESLLFFGRQDQTLELLQRLHQNHFVAVVGSSGSGKSSLIRAGLIPSLKAGYLVEDRDRWTIAIMKPGESPLYNLAKNILSELKQADDETAVTALLKRINEEGVDAILETIEELWLKENINFFLLVDQFEELFRFLMEQNDVSKKDQATDFVNILLQLSQQKNLPVYVVITMRSDFIGDCSQFYGLPEAMNKSQYLVPRLNRIQLKNAIEGPIKLYGQCINAALTSKLLNDAVMVKDELPLLQHALMRVWDYEVNIDKSGELDLRDYEAIGGIEKALSNHADEALQSMTENELIITKKLFQSLTAIDENGRKIRRPAYVQELIAITTATKQQLLDIVNRFIENKRSFLIISNAGNQSDAIIDISHESLIRQWNTLNEWVDEEGDAAKNYLRLVEASDLFNQQKKDLLSGSELLILSRWYDMFKPSAVWAKRYAAGYKNSVDYLNESIQHQQQEAKNKVKKRRTQIALSAFAVLAVIISLILFNVKQSSLRAQAETQRQSAEKNASLAIFKTHVADSVAAVAEMQKNNAIKAKKQADTLRLEAERQTGIASVQTKIAVQKTLEAVEQANVAKAALQQLKTASDKINNQYKAFRLNALAYDWETKDPTIALRLAEAAMKQDDDSIFISTAQRIYERNSFYKTIVKDSFSKSPDFVFSNDGSKVLIKSYNRGKIWSLNEPQTSLLYTYQGDLTKTSFTADLNKMLLFAGDSVEVFNIINHKKLFAFKDATVIKNADFSPNSSRIVTLTQHTASIWDSGGKKVATTNDANNLSRSYSLQNDVLLTESITRRHDSGFILYKIKSGDNVIARTFVFVRTSISTFNKGGYRFFLSPNKTTGIFFSDSTIHIWNLLTNKEEIKRTNDIIRKVVFSESTNKLLAVLNNNTAILFADDTTVKFIGHSDNINDARLSGDGSKVLTASDDNTARMWNAADGSLISTITASDKILTARFSADGLKIITGLDDGEVKMWKLPVTEFIGNSDEINLVAYSSNNIILTGSKDATARLWTLAGKLLDTFTFSSQVPTVSFSPNGKNFLTASNDTALIWNTNKKTIVKELIGHNNTIQTSAFSPDGALVLTGGDDETARLWNLSNSGDTGQIISTHRASIYTVAFSQDGKYFLTGSIDSSVIIYTADGTELKTINAGDIVYCAAFSPDGKMIVTGLSNHKAILWNLNGDSLAVFNHNADVESVAFSPDGTKVLTGSWDNTAKLWDIKGNLLRTFKVPENIRVRSVTFSPDGKKIFVGASDGIGRLYDARSVQEFLKSDDIDILKPEELDAVNNKDE